MQCKMAIAMIVKNFDLTVNEKTQDHPLQLDPNQSLNIKIGGLWLNFEPKLKKLDTKYGAIPE